MPAVIALAKGWNPVQHITLAQWNPEFASQAGAGIYVEHYAKGAWFVEAAIYQATGNIELGKAANLILIVAAFVVSWSVLLRLGVGRKWSTALATVAALNPVAIYQSPTFYVDGQLASLFTICLFLSIDYLRAPRRWVLALLACAFLLLIEVKFTGLVYAVLMISGLAAGAWMLGRRHAAVRYAVALFCLGVFAVGVPGYQPYVTNTVNYGHPFYPAVGQEAGRNIQWKQAAPEFMAMNRVAKLGISVFSKSSNTNWEWKLPMSIYKSELVALTGADARYGGFGPLFSGVLILALLLSIFTAKGLAASERKAYALLLTMLVVTILINPEAWWARLSPQLWLLPLIPVVAVVHGAGPARHWLAALVVALMLGNSMLVGLYNAKYALDRSAELDSLIARLHMASQTGHIAIQLSNGFQVTTALRLQNNGVRYMDVDILRCTLKHVFTHIFKTCE
jgi:hypothetical protein